MNNKTEGGFKPESFKWLASKEDLIGGFVHGIK